MSPNFRSTDKKTLIPFKITLLFLLLSVLPCTAQTTAMTFNIRYATPADGQDQWESRKEEVVTLINKYHPDFLGIQEAMPQQTAFLQQHLQEYTSIGHGRDGVNTPSEAIPLFFKKDKYRLLEQQVFWLSPTPEKFSTGWDAALPRIAVYGKFKDLQSADTLHVINTHFDHMGKQAREESAKMLVHWIGRQLPSQQSLILMGDLNAAPDTPEITLLNNALTDTFPPENSPQTTPKGTFTGFDTSLTNFPRIDYIFIRGFRVLKASILDDKRKNGRYPSDHFPVFTQLEFLSHR